LRDLGVAVAAGVLVMEQSSHDADTTASGVEEWCATAELIPTTVSAVADELERYPKCPRAAA
jgi:hypothetical protein